MGEVTCIGATSLTTQDSKASAAYFITICTISSIVGGYRSAVTKHANRLGLEFAWQSRFPGHVIRDEKSFIAISEYIMNSPYNWSEDTFFN